MIDYHDQWWFNRMAGYDVTYTSGYGGQHIYTVPELDLVVVTAADYSDSEGMSAQRTKITNLVRSEILPAVIP